MITSAINTTSIPILSEVRVLREERQTIHTNNLLNIVMVLSILIIALALYLTAYLENFGLWFRGEQYNLI